MLRLAVETEPGWVEAMEADLPTFLVDHAHCEKKAASTAINLIFRYQDRIELMAPLSRVAREELEHFEAVLERLAAMGQAFGPLAPSPYAAALYEGVRRPEPDRLLDTLLVCALIEARSCERMQRLAEELSDRELARFYGELVVSEARHHALYVDLALLWFDRRETLERLSALAQHEAEVLQRVPGEIRVHSRAPGVAP